MSEFKVNLQKLITAVEESERLASILQQSADDARTIRQGLRWQILQRERINSRLNTSARKLEDQCSALRRVVNTGRQAARLYQENEEKLLQGTAVPPQWFSREQILEWLSKIKFGRPLTYILQALGVGMAGSVTSGSISGTVNFLGLGLAGSLSGPGASVDFTAETVWDVENGEAGVELGAEAEGHLAQGKLNVSYGYMNSSVTGTVGSVAATGVIGASLFKDGKFTPAIQAEVSVEGSVLSGEIENRIGTEDNNIHAKASGELLGAEAEAGVAIGKITVDGDDGNSKTAYGVKAEAGAEAYLAEGEVSGGFTIFGIKIDAALEGKAGGAGVSAGGSISTAGVSGKIGAGLGLGAGLEISIDWSNFSLW